MNNERIIKLAEQAGLELGIILENFTTPVKTITVEQRKFAELIVRECCQVCVDQWIEKVGDDARDCYLAIQEHFGVTE